MNIIYACDDNYAPQCGISILSLLENNKDQAIIHFYILDNGISPENREKLYALVSTNERLLKENYQRKLVFININDFKRKIGFNFDTTGFNPIVLARLFLAEYLPEHVDKALYLDCDTVVNGNLAELERLNMDDMYIAAVPELFMPEQNKANIGLDPDETYFNAGVLWINLKKWREDNIRDTFTDYYSKNGGMLPYNDQDIINHCCKGYILKIAQKYNMSPNLPYFPRNFIVKIQPGYNTDSVEEYKDMIENPVIIHFLGDERPWINGNKNYYRKYFYMYRNMSAWANLKNIHGKEWYMFCCHLLNLFTRICPWGRIAFSKYIGINIYKWIKKE